MGWQDALPRKYFEKYERIPVESDWFEVYRMPCEVYDIAEPRHTQEVHSFLIVGSERALLWDTGMGFDDIRKVCRELYDGEIFVVNSHCHGDHTADNWRFEKVYLFDDKGAHAALREGFSPEELASQLTEGSFWGEKPASFVAEKYCIPPIEPIPVKEGYLFDLGNRQLEVVHTPGHSPDSIMLLEREKGLLFTGDAFYLGPLYAHIDNPKTGKSSLEDYKKSFVKLNALSGLKYLYCSHNEPLAPAEYIQKARDALDTIPESGPDMPGGESRRYEFEGFSVVVK